MADWATIEDVAAIYEEGSLPARAEAVLDRTERRLKVAVPDVADRIALDEDEDGYLDPDLVKDVLVDATCRALRNPKGYSYERGGDYAYGLRGGKDATFTDEELALLREQNTTLSGQINVTPGVTPPCPLPPSRADVWTGDRLAGMRP